MRISPIILAVVSGFLLVGCGDSDPKTTAPQDTREVKHPAEPQAPSLSQRMESSAPVAKIETIELVEAELDTGAAPVEMKPVPPSGSDLYASCAACHGMTGNGGLGPQLAGKTADYLTDKMVAYRAGEQIGPMTAMMAPMAANMTDDEIERVIKHILTF